MEHRIKGVYAEDDSKLLETYSKLLESRNIDVLPAKDGLEAIELIQTRDDIDFLIADLYMPRMDGIELIKKLRGQSYQKPIIVITGVNDSQSAFSAMKAGADNFLFKPVNIDELSVIIKKLVVYYYENQDSDLAKTYLKNTMEFNIPSSLKYKKSVIQFIVKFLKLMKVSEKHLHNMRIPFILDEIISNSIEHGNKFHKDKKVKINCIYSKDIIEFRISDEGEGFDYEKVKNPLSEENIFSSRGRGILLCKHLVDKMEYSDNGRTVTIVIYNK